MPSEKVGRDWAIIGVVGKTYKDDLPSNAGELLAMAEQVGARLATHDQPVAVLTGGHHLYSETSVKYRALAGAKDSNASLVRLMGILPNTISRQLEPPISSIQITAEATGRFRNLYAHTQLPSPKRDWITGEVVDALIALEGESGTPREVAAAIKAKRPVVFLNSLAVLRPKIQAIEPHLELPANPIEATTAEEAVDAVLYAVGLLSDNQESQLRGKFPDVASVHPDKAREFNNLRSQFEAELLKL